MPIERELKRGEVYLGDPGPVVGHEQGGRRPFLVISVSRLNRSPAGLAIAVPLTTTDRGNRLHVRIEPPEGGLDRISYAIPEMVRSLSTLRLQRRLGRTSRDTVEAIANRVGLFVGLGRSR
jgi:mRNA interferase MazF